ncbi:hypothetical protein ACIQ9E_06205 [Streptomyces sp. NPDC094448]|uniref:hypothetical protein n=1 Tax=Streptomyces sp. NPDC094448 TaxID=3366063 RepID=UPI003826674C
MSPEEKDPSGRGRKAVAIRWTQAGLLGLVVVLFAVGIGEREPGGGSSSVMFGLTAASALAIGVLERHRARSVRRFRQRPPGAAAD